MSERQIRRVGGGCWGERRSERNENEGRSDTLELHPIYMSHHPKEGCTEARPGLSEPPRLNGAIYFKKEINRLKPFSVNIVGVRCQALGSCRGRVLGRVVEKQVFCAERKMSCRSARVYMGLYENFAVIASSCDRIE